MSLRCLLGHDYKAGFKIQFPDDEGELPAEICARCNRVRLC